MGGFLFPTPFVPLKPFFTPYLLTSSALASHVLIRDPIYPLLTFNEMILIDIFNN